MKKSIIFDLDGTLWDSTGCVCAIWNRVLNKYEDISLTITQEIVSKMMGKTMNEIGKTLFPNLTEERRQQIIADFGNEEINYLSQKGAILYEGLEETLKILSLDYNLYIVSNCQDGYVEAFLHAHQLKSYFKDYEMSGRTGLDKGHNIKLIMKRNVIEQAFYVGDTEGDEEASRFAGIPFIYASYGFGKAKNPDMIIHSIKELPKVLLEMKWWRLRL